MAENPLEAMQQDRIRRMLDRNQTLGRALMGLSRQFLRQCDKYGWSAARLWVRVPHLDSRGFIEVKYRAGHGGHGRYTNAINASTIALMIGQQQASLTEFLQLCRPWRIAVERLYEQGYAFAFDKGVRFEDLAFGSFHVETARRRAWAWIATNDVRRTDMELAGLM